MPEMTMLEAAKLSQDVVESTLTRIIVEASPMLEDLPQKSIDGGTYTYNMESYLGGISFRGVNGSYTPNNGVINPRSERLVIMGGEVKIDKYIVEVSSNAIDAKTEYYGMKARAYGLYFSEQFIEGDTAVNPFGFDGIRKRIAGNQLLYADGSATGGGATLTLALIDRLLDLVVGDNSQKVMYMNKTLRRKITTLVSAQTGTARVEYTLDNFNRQVTMYANCPIKIIEREDDASTFLDFDEDDGLGNLDTASIYCVRYGMDFIHGIMHGSIPSVEDFPPSQPGPFYIGRIEGYHGIVFKHPRSAARLSHINNA